MKKHVGERFSEFFEKWVCQDNEYLQQLLKVLSSKENIVSEVGCERRVAEQQALVSKVTQHYKEYYTVKWALAHEDVLPFFSPVWVSPFESAYSWITGWKPSTIFKAVDAMRSSRLAGQSLGELTQEQLRMIEELRVKIRSEEEKVEREMERQQVGVADRKMVDLARLSSRVMKNGEGVRQVEGAVKGLMAGLEKVMKAADCVRLRTLKGVLDVLSPLQRVEFLAGTSMLLFRLRQWGKIRTSTICTNQQL